ncbi:MAG: transcriptional regulator, partial [Actinomycetia bacterium]|nr:transcriptional regulator [Actinomycetes bacterium]
LLDLYGAARDERVALETLARDAREEEWWHRYRDLPEWFQVFLSLEDDACVERLYDTHLVPGLFQIPSYAEAVIRAWRPTIPHREVQRRVDVRMKRQALLDKTEALELWTIIDESVLHRVVGSTEVMAEQLTHLIEVANRPNVTLQVLPFSAGASPAMGRSFVVLEFPAATDPIVYVEVIAGGLYHRSPDDVARHRLIYEHLQASALSEPASVELIAQVLRNHSP